jgi:hypothetical protein
MLRRVWHLILFMLNAIMLNAIMLNAIMLTVIMLTVVMLSLAEPNKKFQKCMKEQPTYSIMTLKKTM